MPTYNLTHQSLDNLRASCSLAAGLPLPQKVSFAVLKNSNEIARHLKEYDQKAQELLVEYAERDDNGKPVSTPREDGRVSFRLQKERIDEYAAARRELDTIVCENVTIHMVPESAFDAMREPLSPRDLSLVAWMVDGVSTLESESTP